MSDAFDAALNDAFGVGESIRKAKAALKNKTWDANEDGETAMISKALNPPSLGQRESSVAKRSKRDWSWVYKALAGVLIAVLVVIGAYYGIRAVKAKLAKSSEVLPPAVPVAQAAPIIGQTAFGAVAAGKDLYAEWVVYLHAVAVTIKGTPSAMREAVDSVRADVLHGLAVRVGQGYDTVSASDLKSAVGAGYAAYHKRYHAKRDSGLDRLRSCVDGALVAIHHALPRTRMRSTLGDLTARMFGESWLNKPSDEARVYAIYQLRDSLRVAAQFGRPRAGGKCLFVDNGSCPNKCARDASVCDNHRLLLPTGGSDLEGLAAHLASVPNPTRDKIRAMATDLEGMIAWPREGPDALTYDLVLAGPASTAFGASMSLGEMMGASLTGVRSRGVSSARDLVVPVEAIAAAPTDPPAVLSGGGYVVPVEGFVQLPKEPTTEGDAWNGSEGWDNDWDNNNFFDPLDSETPADSGSSGSLGSSGTSAPALVPKSNITNAASTLQRAIRRRLSKSAGRKAASATKTETPSISASSSEPAVPSAKKQARKQAWLARRAQMRDQRKAQVTNGEDFLRAAHGFVKADTPAGAEMARRFEERRRKRAVLLPGVAKAPFLAELKTFLYNVPIDPELRAQQSTVALFWARRIVAFQESGNGSTKEAKASFALYELIRKNEEIVRREIALTSIPLTVKEAAHYAERDYNVLRRAASTSAHAELEGLLMKLRVAFHDEPVLSTDSGDPIRAAYDALVARGKRAFTERVGREGRELEDRVVHGADAVRESTARWTKLVGSMGQWASRRIVYEHAVPGPRPSADLDVMLQAGMDSLVLRAEEAKKTPSIADQISGQKELATKFGASSTMGERLTKLAETDLGSYVKSALGVGTGGWADTLLNAGTSAVEMIALTKAITTAAKVGEGLIMQLLAFVVEGIRMLLKALGGGRWEINDQIQSALGEVADTPERRRELLKEKAKVDKDRAELALALPKRREVLTKDLSTLRAFLDGIDGGKRASDAEAEAKDKAEAKAKAKADAEAAAAEAKANADAAKLAAASFGSGASEELTDATTSKVLESTDPADLAKITAALNAQSAGMEKKPGVMARARGTVTGMLTRVKTKGADAASDARKRGGEAYVYTKEKVAKIPGVPKHIWELIKAAPEFLKKLILNIWAGFWEVFETGNILDLFGILVEKIQDAVANAVSGTGDGAGKGMFNWGLGVIALIELGAFDFDDYMKRVREWCMSPKTIRGLLTDPAGVLDGENNDANKSLLAKHRAVAVPLIWFLFLFRAAQIIKAIFGTSLVTGLVCRAIVKMRGNLGDTIMSVLGSTVDRIAKSVGCEATDTEKDSNAADDKALGVEIDDLSDELARLQGSTPEVLDAAREKATKSAIDAEARAVAVQARLDESERRNTEYELEKAAALATLALATPIVTPLETTPGSPTLTPDPLPIQPIVPGVGAFGRAHRRYRY